MSKELEALKNMSKIEFKTLDNGSVILLEDTKSYAIVEQALTPPTEEEVCEFLRLAFGYVFEYDKKAKWFYKINEEGSHLLFCWLMPDGTIKFFEDFKPEIHIMIGRFYEGLDNEKV
jgi:hypothetical protein